jgi:hypothetical protein
MSNAFYSTRDTKMFCSTEYLKEVKRKERAAKQKQKIKDYESKIKSEAEAIEVIRMHYYVVLDYR